MFDADHLAKTYPDRITPDVYKLACVFLVMALGAKFDLNRPLGEIGGHHLRRDTNLDAAHPRARELFNLGKACLDIGGTTDLNPAAVQAMHLCGTYMLNDQGSASSSQLHALLISIRYECGGRILGKARKCHQDCSEGELCIYHSY